MPVRSKWWARLGLLLIATALVVAEVHAQWREQFSRNFVCTQPLSLTEFNHLVESHTEIPIALDVEGVGLDYDRILRFTLSQESAVYLSASAKSAEATFIHPLIAQREDNRRFLLPLIRSGIHGRQVWNAINLGHFSAGDHTISVSQDFASTLPLPELVQFSATRPSDDSELSVFIDHNPVVIVKDQKNVLDDIPLLGYSSICKQGSGYLVTSSLIFSSENGGTMPVKLMADTQRTVDIEWVMKQRFKPSEDSLKASHRLFQKKSHGEEKFAGKELLGNRPILAVTTANNNFGDGRIHIGRWSIPSPFAANSDEGLIYYAPKPRFLAPLEWSQNVLNDIPELQQWSQFELAMEGCVDLDNQDDVVVQEFLYDLEWVRQQLSVSFPDRGCGRQLLQLPQYEA